MAKWADALLLWNHKRGAGGGKNRTVASAAIRAAGLCSPATECGAGARRTAAEGSCAPQSFEQRQSEVRGLLRRLLLA